MYLIKKYDFTKLTTTLNFQFEDLDEESIEALKELLVMRAQLPDNAEYHEFQDKLRARQMTLYGEQENEVLNY